MLRHSRIDNPAGGWSATLQIGLPLLARYRHVLNRSADLIGDPLSNLSVAEEFNTGRITHGPLGIAVEAHVGGHGQICGVARTDPRRSATQTCVNASTPNAGSLAAADDKPTRDRV